jgi:hypothetical protein
MPELPSLDQIREQHAKRAPSHTLRNVLMGATGLLAGAAVAFVLSQNPSGTGTKPAATSAAPATTSSATGAPAATSSAASASAAVPAPAAAQEKTTAPEKTSAPPSVLPGDPVTPRPEPKASNPAPIPVATAPRTEPPASDAAFQITTNPSGAEAVFDGSSDLHCTTPCSVDLPLGRHALLLRHPGYREAQRVFTLPNDPGLIVTMEATAGTLSVITNPPGLAMVVDGREQGRRTPVSLSLPVGEHRVQVLKGSEKQEFVVDIRDGVVSQKNIDWP